jgi:hypothetical protein
VDGLFSDWWLEGGFGRPLSSPYQNYDREFGRAQTVTAGRARVSAIEMWLVWRAYEDILTELRCKKCGAPLGRKLRLILPAGYNPPSWRLLAVTRCGGWRRHRHIARVTESARDLLFGPFQLS